jgi:hypothetical protein
MPQFMLLLNSAPDAMDHLSPTEIQTILEKYKAWTGKIAAAGKLVSGQKLMDEGGKAMTLSGGKLAVVDGPFSETKEVVGGYFVIKAASYEEAIQVASDCPHMAFGAIVVRQVDFMGQPEP